LQSLNQLNNFNVPIIPETELRHRAHTSQVETPQTRTEPPQTENRPEAEQPQPAAAAAAAVAARPAQQAQQQAINPDREENDWLSFLNNCVSFLVLFSIIFYYSSFQRFLVIFTVTVLLIM
jgi:hypothetical protein